MKQVGFVQTSIALLILCNLLSCSHSASRNTSGMAAQKESVEELDSKTFSPETWTDLAKRAYRAGNYPRATRLLETVFAYEPQGPDLAAQYLLYYLYLAQGDYPRALLLAKSLVKRNPYRAGSYYQVALAELWSGETQSAVQNFQRALEFSDAPARVHFYLGIAHAKLENEKAQTKSFQTAEREYRQILKKNPDDFVANYELAHLYLYWQGNWKKAEALLENARAHAQQAHFEMPLESFFYRSYFLSLLQGMYFTHKGQSDEALKHLWEALRHTPDGTRADTAEIYYYLGLNFTAQKAEAPARNFLKKASLMDPSGPYAVKTEKALRGLASVRRQKGRTKN